MQKTSVSALSALDKGLAQYNEYINNKEQTDAMKFGDTFHAFCLEGKKNLSSYTVAKQELLCNMRDSLLAYDEYMTLLNPSITTNEEWIEFEYMGVIMRAKLDQIRVFEQSKVIIICDLKTIANTSDMAIFKATADYNMLTQLACYKKAYQTKYPKYKDYTYVLMNCFVSKEKKPKCRLVNRPVEHIELGENTLNALINKLKRLDELTIDNNIYKENNPIPEPFEMPEWVFRKYNQNIEKWT